MPTEWPGFYLASCLEQKNNVTFAEEKNELMKKEAKTTHACHSECAGSCRVQNKDGQYIVKAGLPCQCAWARIYIILWHN